MKLTYSNKKYTKEELLTRLQAKAQELGRTPKCKDINEDPKMPSVHTYYIKFGSMTRALREADLTLNKSGRRKKYGDLELLDILRSKAKGLGRIPTSKDVDADLSMPSYATYQYHFGSFQKAIKKAGLKPVTRHYAKHSGVELSGVLRGKAKALCHARYHFSSPKNVTREAGPVQPKPEAYIRYTNEELLDMLKEKTKELGKIPTQDELNSYPDIPSFSTYVYRFGSFQSACKKADLRPRKHGRSVKYTDTELLDMLRSKAKELGRPPSWDDLGKYNNMPARQVYTYRFGGLRKALKKAGIL